MPYPSHVPTMISSEEKRYLYWLTSHVWSGAGDVVEIGPWLGGSTVCLAEGMRASQQKDIRKRLKTYDNFIWREFMSQRACLQLRPGDSFMPQFMRNIQDWAEIIDAYQNTLPDEVIERKEASKKRYRESEQIGLFDGAHIGNLVEILFVDGAKSWRGMTYLLKVLHKHFIPGKTLLVCQDFKYWGTYWVPIMMSRISEYLEPAHNLLRGTTVTFRLTQSLPAQTVDSLEDHVADIPSDGGLRGIDCASSLLRKDHDFIGAANVSLASTSFLSHQDHIAEAAQAFRLIQKKWPVSTNFDQLERCRKYLLEEHDISIPPTMSIYVMAVGASLWRRFQVYAKAAYAKLYVGGS